MHKTVLRLSQSLLPEFRSLSSPRRWMPSTPVKSLNSLHFTQTRCIHAQSGKLHNSQSSPHQTSQSSRILLYSAAFAFVGTSLFISPLRNEAPSSKAAEDRLIRLEDIHKHGADSQDGIWVSRGTDVFDITDWVENHPGGSVILRAAGGALEPYWNVFSFHLQPEILEMLNDMKIGRVHPDDLVDGKVPADAIEDPFQNDPSRDKRLQQHTQKPCNAETPADGLQTFITPNEIFFTRNHLWVPPASDEWQLEVDLGDGSAKMYTIKELQNRFQQHTITATLQCSGNRRGHMTESSRATSGLQWDAGAISNADWTGVKLRDVLKDAGFPIDSIPEDTKHAQFHGAEGYGSSIPIRKACSAEGDVLLVFSMNGKPLPPDHGAPVRLLCPGHVAARSVKWLSRISLSEEESTSQWQRRDYKCFGPNVTAAPNWDDACAIQETPVQSAITSITQFSTHSEEQRNVLKNYGMEEDFVKISGYAYSGGGRAIQRVDVSVDSGLTWRQAKLEDDDAKGAQRWSWKKWSTIVPRGYIGKEIVVKAIDEAYNTQPDNFEPIWNLRGNLTTAWHRVPRPTFT